MGAAALIDTAARLRGVAAVSEGRSVSLSRTIGSSSAPTPEDRPSAYSLEATQRREGRLVVARDRLVVDNHGMVNTHIDGLNHFGFDGTWHGGAPADPDAEDGPSIADWADAGLMTRGVLLDIPAVRGTPWVAGGEPVGAEDLDAAVKLAGVDPAPGDALLLYMGRDAYEAAGNDYGIVGDESGKRPGIGPDGVRWVAEHRPSILAWDLMEASGEGEGSHYLGHLLIWATGLVVIDNCDHSAARDLLAGRTPKAGLLSVAPLKLPRATGCLVNPLLLI
jgi:kynurenine formamidase